MTTLRNNFSPETGREQFRFRKGKGTRKSKKATETQSGLCAIFVDYEKAYDIVI